MRFSHPENLRRTTRMRDPGSRIQKLDPGALEEWLFYDPPSGRLRILAAIRLKAEHEADYTSSQIRR